MTRPAVVEENETAQFYRQTWGNFFESRREPLIRWIMRLRNLQRPDAEDAYQEAVHKIGKAEKVNTRGRMKIHCSLPSVSRFRTRPSSGHVSAVACAATRSAN